VKRDAATKEQSLYSCRFVPLLGRYGWRQSARDANQE